MEHYNFNSTKNQQIKREFVNREVIYCVSSMMYELGQMDQPPDYDTYLNLCERLDYEKGAREEGWVPAEDALKFSLYRASLETDIDVDDITFIRIEDGRAVDASEEADWQDLCYEKDIEPYRDEVYEHWIVTGWFGEKLQEYGETVDDYLGMTIWGRCTTGQAILLDSVISSICYDMGILEGQPHEWKI